MRSRKVWTEDDTEALRYWHGCGLREGRIARTLKCSRRSIMSTAGGGGDWLRASRGPARSDQSAGTNYPASARNGPIRKFILVLAEAFAETIKQTREFGGISPTRLTKIGTDS